MSSTRTGFPSAELQVNLSIVKSHVPEHAVSLHDFMMPLSTWCASVLLFWVPQFLWWLKISTERDNIRYPNYPLLKHVQTQHRLVWSNGGILSHSVYAVSPFLPKHAQGAASKTASGNSAANARRNGLQWNDRRSPCMNRPLAVLTRKLF